mmetsp:Transcript_6031/g.24927  ORF Transcript_6031/g.24927 Transcript_6031/m.24927 type:complete len:216 (-) Transcript_6031:303-950(-)
MVILPPHVLFVQPWQGHVIGLVRLYITPSRLTNLPSRPSEPRSRAPESRAHSTSSQPPRTSSAAGLDPQRLGGRVPVGNGFFSFWEPALTFSKSFSSSIAPGSLLLRNATTLLLFSATGAGDASPGGAGAFFHHGVYVSAPLEKERTRCQRRSRTSRRYATAASTSFVRRSTASAPRTNPYDDTPSSSFRGTPRSRRYRAHVWKFSAARRVTNPV